VARLIISVEGQSLSKADKRRLVSPLVVGVILFARNYANPEQLLELTHSIKACCAELLIFVDQEGGRVQRFQDGFTRLPAAKDWEEKYQQDPERALCDLSKSAKTMLAELRACGVDISLVPCLDTDRGRNAVIGDRSFSSDPDRIVQLARASIRALKEEGMPVTGKHFPGHGYVSLDSHLAMPVDERSWEVIKQSDAKPFIALLPELDLVMPAHIAFPAVDRLPVTFSRVWLQDILRGELGFRGCIVSDCLSMVGAAQLFPDVVERVNAAHEAGCDILHLCNSDSEVDELMDRQDELIASSALHCHRILELNAV
jgi:beta-N-acetylhexosaminidase